MTLLQIDKKAANAADGQLLITQTRELADPFGVPTIHIDTADVRRIYEMAAKYEAKPMALRVRDGDCAQTEVLSPKLQRLLQSDVMRKAKPLENFLLSTVFQNNFISIFKKDADEKSFLNSTYPLFREGFDKNASLYPQEDYVPPLGNNVVCAGESNAFMYSRPSDVALLAKADKFYPIWHEIAHGTGAGEPQADLMAAIITKQSFEPSHVLRMWADERAMTAVLNFHDARIRNIYGWGCVDVNDFIANQPAQKIAELDEAQIKELRFNKIDTLANTVMEVGSSLRSIVPEAGKKISTLAASREALYLAENKFKDNEVARYVCKRFALACTRTSMGYGGYNIVPEPALPNGKYPSFTDEPEI